MSKTNWQQSITFMDETGTDKFHQHCGIMHDLRMKAHCVGSHPTPLFSGWSNVNCDLILMRGVGAIPPRLQAGMIHTHAESGFECESPNLTFSSSRQCTEQHDKEIFAHVIGYKKGIRMLSRIFQDLASLRAEAARGPYVQPGIKRRCVLLT